MAPTMEDYLRAKVKELESSKSEVKFELFRLKHNGGVEAVFVAEMQNKFNSNVEAATKKINYQDTIIANLKDELANEKKYSKTLTSTVESLKQAGSHTQSQITNRNKSASGKLQTANEKIKKLQEELNEKSRDVVKFRTEWKRAKFERDLEGDSGIQAQENGGAALQMQKKQFVEPHAGGSSDEDDEEPLVKQWALRKTAVPSEGMAKIKLEK